METQSFIIEAGNNQGLTWSSHTILDSDIDSVVSHYGDQCNIIQISSDQAELIQKAPSTKVAGLINNILMNNNQAQMAA